MMSSVYISICGAYVICFLVLTAFTTSHKTDYDTKSALFLTPYIEAGNLKGGQDVARVQSLVGTVKSYAGYLTVNKRYYSNLFFWFFPRNATNWENSTTVLWLQGGPGASSLFGTFVENGPYVFKNGTLKERYYSWTSDFNVLYIDNPVGAGFSFTNSENGYARNQTDIASNLYEAVRQFFLLFFKLQKNKFIISGESYAGKYAISLANFIREKNLQSTPKINLYGIFIGNPFLCVEYMLDYSNYLYSIGLLDVNGRKKMEDKQTIIKLLIKSGKWEEATPIFANTFFETGLNNSLFNQLTGLKQSYNFLKENRAIYPYISFLQNDTIRDIIHVGPYKLGDGQVVKKYLLSDILKCVKSDLEHILEKYKILIFAGQLDIICPYYLVENILYNLEWSGSVSYQYQQRNIFHVDQYLAGYYRTIKNLTEVLVRNAGHMATMDKSQWVRVLLRRFENGSLI